MMRIKATKKNQNHPWAMNAEKKTHEHNPGLCLTPIYGSRYRKYSYNNIYIAI